MILHDPDVLTDENRQLMARRPCSQKEKGPQDAMASITMKGQMTHLCCCTLKAEAVAKKAAKAVAVASFMVTKSTKEAKEATK